MPEGSHTALHHSPMGEEYPQLSSLFCARDHEQANTEMGPDCYSRLCADHLDRKGQRPMSQVSTLSSGSSRDSHSLFGSTMALTSSSTPPIPSEEDIDLELSPTESVVKQSKDTSPVFRRSRGCWQELADPSGVSSPWSNISATSMRKAGTEILHTPGSPVITDTMTPNPKLTYVDRVIMEIIETERMYVKDLRSIVEDYLAHIIDSNNFPIRPEQVCALFGNIEDIYEFNSELLQSLDMCENDPVAVAQCFVEKSNYFEIYTQYCTNYPNSVATLTDCMRSKTLEKFFRDRQAALKRSLPLGSYLLKPVQRILKYHLLLQEIAKHFSPDEEGYEVVQEAIDTMTGVAWYINDMKRKHEHAVRVQEIQSLLINWKGPDLTTYGELVLEGTFHVLRAKNTRTLFLFQKMLLITKKRGEHYVYKIHISCSTLMLLDSAKDPLLFSVIHFKHPKQPHTVQAKSVEEKRLWAHHIKRLILENHNTIAPPKAKDAIQENSYYSAKFNYIPKRLKRVESCKADEFHFSGLNGRRRSEPVKQIIRRTKGVLKHADSESVLLGNRSTLHPAASVPTLASDLGEPQAGRLCVDGLIPGTDSLEQLNSTDSGPKVGASPNEGGHELQMTEQEKEDEEGGSYKEDILMGDDQDDQYKDTADLNDAQRMKADTHSPGEKHMDEASTNLPPTEVGLKEHDPGDCVPRDCSESEAHNSQNLKSPTLPSEELEAVASEPADTSGESKEEDGVSDSSGLQIERSRVTNGELSEEEEEVLTDMKSILPCSVLDHASTIAEHFTSSLSQRTTSVSGDLASAALPSPISDKDVFPCPLAFMDMDKNECSGDSSSKEALMTSVEFTAEPALCKLSEGEHISSLSNQDRLLIHKIRRYYEHAENQDADFSIKRRESLSYIPAGLVRHLSRQLNNLPREQAVPAYRKSLARTRPTSWSVFDLPGLDRKTEIAQMGEAVGLVQAKAKSLSFAEFPFTDEEFSPISEVFVQQTAQEKKTQDIGSDTLDVNTRKLLPEILEDYEKDAASECSSLSSPTTNIPAVEEESSRDFRSQLTPAPQEKSQVSYDRLPRIISFRACVNEDQILQDMGKMKNKVFQLARQYSQRIKNNRPMVWQRSQESTSQTGFKNMPSVPEERLQSRKKDKPCLRLPLNTGDEVVVHDLHSPSLDQSPSPAACSHSTVTSQQSEPFHWPDVQELRSKYNPTQLNVDTSCASKVADIYTLPNRLLESCMSRCNGCSKNSNDSSDLHRALIDSPTTKLSRMCHERGGVVQDWPQPRSKIRIQPLLCRWSSLDQMLESLPLNKVQNLYEPMRSYCTASQVSLRATDPSKQEGHVIQRVTPDSPARPAVPVSSGKMSESNLVKSLREKFQSLSTSS